MLVGEVVDEEHGRFSDACGPFADFEAVELVEADVQFSGNIKSELCPLCRSDRGVGEVEVAAEFEEFKLECSHLAVGDDEEVPAATCWIEILEAAEFVVQLGQFTLAVLGFFETCAVVVKEEWFDGLEDIFLGGVVLTGFSASFFAFDGLEHATEDCRRDD
ncbi:hypothetical protein BFG51_03625 [Dietzia alimentaria]|nr:hypothetical protein BFG51_03625 [Dietzia alimentaria]